MRNRSLPAVKAGLQTVVDPLSTGQTEEGAVHRYLRVRSVGCVEEVNYNMVGNLVFVGKRKGGRSLDHRVR